MKKRIMVAILAACMALTMVACGGGSDDSADVAEDTTEVAEEETTDETEDETEAEFIQVPVSIVNGTGVDIYELYLSGGSQEEWGDDLLGENTMPNGTYLDLVLNVDEENLAWDMMVTDSEGTAIEWYGIDISDMSTDGFCVELLFDDGTATANVVNDMTELAGDYTESAE